MSQNTMHTASPPSLKLSAYLGVASTIATLAVIPYTVSLAPGMFSRVTIPLWQLSVIQAFQAGVFCWLLAWTELKLGYSHGLDAPVLRKLVYGVPFAAPKSHWIYAIVLGAATAALIIVIAPVALISAHGPTLATLWRGALACFYGGVVEEILCRLFLVTLIVCALAKLSRRTAMAWMYIAAIVMASLAFGVGHLPAFLAEAPRSLSSIAQIVGLNAFAGIVFGVLFWKRGLEHAMLAHFSADIVLHVAFPALSATL